LLEHVKAKIMFVSRSLVKLSQELEFHEYLQTDDQIDPKTVEKVENLKLLQKLKKEMRQKPKNQYFSKTKLGLVSPFEMASEPTVEKDFSNFIKYKM
jgi:hypothetical protein